MEMFLSKCQPHICEVFTKQPCQDMPNLLAELSAKMAEKIASRYLIQGGEELVQLLLLLSHNFMMFQGALQNYLISNFFQALTSIKIFLDQMKVKQLEIAEEQEKEQEEKKKQDAIEKEYRDKDKIKILAINIR